MAMIPVKVAAPLGMEEEEEGGATMVVAEVV